MGPSIAFDVGYESPSQLSPEYRRMFGAPPQRHTAGIYRKLSELALVRGLLVVGIGVP